MGVWETFLCRVLGWLFHTVLGSQPKVGLAWKFPAQTGKPPTQSRPGLTQSKIRVTQPSSTGLGLDPGLIRASTKQALLLTSFVRKGCLGEDSSRRHSSRRQRKRRKEKEDLLLIFGCVQNTSRFASCQFFSLPASLQRQHLGGDSLRGEKRGDLLLFSEAHGTRIVRGGCPPGFTFQPHRFYACCAKCASSPRRTCVVKL